MVAIFFYTIHFPREEEKESWPVSERLEIESHKRGKLLGPGGIHLKKLTLSTGVHVRITFLMLYLFEKVVKFLWDLIFMKKISCEIMYNELVVNEKGFPKSYNPLCDYFESYEGEISIFWSKAFSAKVLFFVF